MTLFCSQSIDRIASRYLHEDGDDVNPVESEGVLVDIT